MAVDFKDLLKAGLHFGHKSALWSPKMKPFIWGVKHKVHLIDVAKTSYLLEQSGKYLKSLAAKGGSILWVGTKKPAREFIEKAGKDLKMPFVINRWIGGTLSNFEQIKKAITRLLHLRDVVKKADTSHYTKKEIVMLQKEVGRLERNVGGIIDLSYPPAALILIDAKRERSAIKEAFGEKIPMVALVDTNTDPDKLNFVIPGNDDSPRSIQFVVEYLTACVEEGQKEYQETKTKEAELAAAPRKKVAPKKAEEKPVEKKAAPKKEVKPVAEKAETAEVKKEEKKAEAPKKEVKPAAEKTEKAVEVKKDDKKDK
jgi:small subunit ribosomal protein S2